MNCAVYGEGSANNQMCQKWFAKLPTEHFTLNNVTQSGRSEGWQQSNEDTKG